MRTYRIRNLTLPARGSPGEIFKRTIKYEVVSRETAERFPAEEFLTVNPDNPEDTLERLFRVYSGLEANGDLGTNGEGIPDSTNFGLVVLLAERTAEYFKSLDLMDELGNPAGDIIGDEKKLMNFYQKQSKFLDQPQS